MVSESPNFNFGGPKSALHPNDSNGGCFSAATEILTPNGTRKISDLKKGDIILSWNEARREMVSSRVKKLRVSKSALTKVSHQHGAIEVTGTHSVLTLQGEKKVWREVSELREGDVLLIWQKGDRNWDGELVPSVVTGLEKLAPQTVYNLDLEKGDNFIADGAVAQSYSLIPKGRIFSGIRRTWRNLRHPAP